MIVPQSCTTTYRRSRTSPVSRSTSAMQQCVADDQPPGWLVGDPPPSREPTPKSAGSFSFPRYAACATSRERQLMAGNALRPHRPIHDLEVGRRDLEQRGSDLERLSLYVAHGVECRAAATRRPAAAARAEHADRADARVAVDDADVLERHAELVGAELCQRRLEPLSVRVLAREDREAAVRLDARLRPLRRHPEAGDLGEVVGSRRGLDQRRQPKPEELAALARHSLLCTEPGDVDDLEQTLQRLAWSRALQSRAACRACRLLGQRHDVAESHFDRVEPQFPCDAVDEDLA